MQLLQATSTSEVQELLDSDEFSFRFDAGVNIPSSAVTIEDKQHLVIAFINNYILARVS